MEQYMNACFNHRKIWEFGYDEIGYISLFRALPDVEYCILGDIIESNSISYPENISPVFKYNSDLFKHPVSFDLIYTDNICSIWRPIPPDNFVSLGDFIERGITPPDINTIICPHISLVVEASLPFESNRSCFWPNLFKDPLPSPPLSFWRIRAPSKPPLNNEPYAFDNNFFICSATFERPNFTVYALKNPLFKEDINIIEDNKIIEIYDNINNNDNNINNNNAINNDNSEVQNNDIDNSIDTHNIINNNIEYEYLPADINPKEAGKLYSNWINSLWFAPTELKTFSEFPESLRFQYLPYYLWYTISIVNKSADIRNITNDWKSISEQSTTEYVEKMLPAYDNETIDEIMIDDMKSWYLSKAQVLKNNKNINIPSFKDPNEIWKQCSCLIQNEEDNKWNYKLKETYQSIRNININISYKNTSYHLILLPIYITEFQYDKKTYCFIVNAQNGSCNGTRPYSILSGFTGWWKQSQIPGIYKGKDLQKSDPRNIIYKSNKEYLVFPASKKNIWSYDVGWCKIQNYSKTDDISIQGKEINGKRIGIIYTLKPNDSIFFSYKGYWVLEIIQGNGNNLKLRGHCSTDGHLHPDLLRMI